MKLTNKTDHTVTFEMSHEEALMIMALVRETCAGTIMHGFDTRVGHSPREVGKIGSALYELLDDVGITE